MTIRLTVNLVVDIPDEVLAHGLLDAGLADAEQVVAREIADDLRVDEWTADGATISEFSVSLQELA